MGASAQPSLSPHSVQSGFLLTRGRERSHVLWLPHVPPTCALCSSTYTFQVYWDSMVSAHHTFFFSSSAPGTRPLYLLPKRNKKLAKFSLKTSDPSPQAAGGAQISWHCTGGPSRSGCDPSPLLPPLSSPLPKQLQVSGHFASAVFPSLPPLSFSF